jgi:hypothetical protein
MPTMAWMIVNAEGLHWVDSSPSQLSKVMFRLYSDSGYSPAVNFKAVKYRK